MNTDDQILEPIPYKPPEGNTKGLRNTIPTGAWLAGLCAIVAAAMWLYITAARSLIINTSPSAKSFPALPQLDFFGCEAYFRRCETSKHGRLIT